MTRAAYHRTHAQDRLQRQRRLIAQEAARLMSEHGIRDFHHAKRKAAARLGILDTQALPRNHEIEDARREQQRLFHRHEQPQLLHIQRAAAIEAMRFLAAYEPRLVGPVLEDSADVHSAVCLHVFSDDPEAVGLFLEEHGVPIETQTRRLRINRKEEAAYPVLVFTANDLPFDITILPRDALRQAPLDRIDAKPMRRASLSTVEALLAQDEASALEQAPPHQQ